MPKNLPTKCKVCQRKRSARLHISRRGLCERCATARMTAALTARIEAVDAATARLAATTPKPSKAAPPEGVGGRRRASPPAK